MDIMTKKMEYLGDFKIIKKISDEKTCPSFLAEHRFMKETHILKIIPENLCVDPDFIKKFETDISTIAKLNHPSIVKIHNVSFFEGKYFLVVDAILDRYEEVMSLDRFLSFNHADLSENEIETILAQVASALDYSHQFPLEEGYLSHGRMHLSNILMEKKEDKIKIFLSDFGIYKFLNEKFFFESQINQFIEGKEDDKYFHYIQNFHFLSPEQLEKNSVQVDAKTDSYAFGVLAYFLLTKKFPRGVFEKPSKVNHSIHENWDDFVFSLLLQDPKNRPLHLGKALMQVFQKQQNLEEVQKTLDDKMQLSFSFSKKEKKKLFLEAKAIDSGLNHLKPILNPQKIDRPIYEPDPGAIFHKEMHVFHYQPKKIEVKEVEPILTEMMVIPGGTYKRGCENGARDEIPFHSISVSSFAVDIHPITNEQFVRFLLAMGGEKDVNNNDILRLRDSRIKRSGGDWIIESGYSKHPVVGVTWHGAFAYAQWIGKRLPTEAEWEIVANGGKNTLYPYGKKIDRSQANFFSSDTTAVKSYPPNDYGIYDIVGNVYEWCQDWYAYNYYETSVLEPENPKGPQQGVYRVLRGGCWKSLQDDLRISHRHRNNPSAVNSTYGFRCAADVADAV